MSDATSPETALPASPPDARFALGRLMLSAALFVAGWVATVMFLIVASRIVPGAAWLGGSGASAVVATLVAGLVARVCHGRLPAWTSGWWAILPIMAVPVGAIAILWLEMA